MKTKHYATLEEAIDTVLTYLSCATPEVRPGEGGGGAWRTHFPLQYFNAAEPIHHDLVPLFEAAHPGHEVLFLPPDWLTYDVVHPAQVTMLAGVVDEENPEAQLPYKDAFSIYHLRTLALRELRGLKLYAKEHVEFGAAIVQSNGTYAAFRDRYVNMKNEWRPLYTPQESGNLQDATFFDMTPRERLVEDYGGKSNSEVIQFLMSVALTFYYEWRVEVGYQGHPTLAFITDHVGALEIFRLRDIPNGASRRAALRHWVLQHWRHRHDDPGALTKVRQHLRGATTFVWNDLQCKIHVSRYDVNKDHRLHQERQLERKQKALYAP